jgi:ATP/maltotriose-dependent transcriptional regulator MalT
VRLYDSADTYRGWTRYTEDVDTARAALDRLVSRARDIGDDWAVSFCLSYQAMTAVLAGDYAAAAEAVAASDAVAQWYHWRPSLWFVEPRCELLIAAGDLNAAAGFTDLLRDDETAPVTHRCMAACLRGKVSAWRGDQAATIRHLELAVRYAEQCEWLDPGIRCRVDVLLAEAYAAAGRAADARRISAQLRELGERLGRPALTGDAARIDALVAAAAGDLDAAAESAQTAVTAHGSSPLRLELARSLLVLGQVQRRRRARRQSRDALRRARDLAGEMSHRPLLTQIEAEMPRIAPERSGRELTGTERKVAELIAAGATNRDAAAELFVSVRTIETHVAAIYRKLGVRSRAELARRLPPSPTATS